MTHDVDALARGVRAGQRRAIAQAITLVESTRADDRRDADQLLERLPASDGHRVGLTGPPGVGKSTLIERLGLQLVGAGHRVAVLAVDPSSLRTGGSILGDKTRMPELARHPSAFIRPSPAAGMLGGVARHSREAIAVMEAAGYDIVIVETVGVGQSETMVAHMVDALVVLALPGAGDELQGIKRGVLEWADLVAVTKADGAGVAAAERARAELERALRLYPARDPEWTPPVLACSAVEGRGIDEIWQALVEHRRVREHSGGWARQRSEQRVHWMWQVVEYSLLEHARGDARFAAELARVDPLVRTGALSPDHAAKRLLACVDSPGPTAVG